MSSNFKSVFNRIAVHLIIGISVSFTLAAAYFDEGAKSFGFLLDSGSIVTVFIFAGLLCATSFSIFLLKRPVSHFRRNLMALALQTTIIVLVSIFLL